MPKAPLAPRSHQARPPVLSPQLHPKGSLLSPFVWLTMAACPLLHAQEPAAAPTPALQIIQQQTVDVGSHRVIFNRVVPPPPQPPPTPAPAPVAAAFPPAAPTPKARAAAGSKRLTRSVNASTNAGEEDAQPRALFLSATVYDHGLFTELRGSDAAGGWRAWSNVDFLLLAGAGQFAAPTNGPTYSLYLGLGSDTSDWLTQAGQYPAGVSSLPAAEASYYFADGAMAAAHPEAAVALDALHLFTDANRPALLQARQQREADQAVHEAQAEYARAHPTPTPDTVINFWPKQNSVFLGH